MSMDNLHCPRCGHGFGRIDRPDYVDPLFVHSFCDFGYDAEARTEGYWLQAIRSELARQALDYSTHCDVAYSAARVATMDGYEWLGKNPIRLPGEDA